MQGYVAAAEGYANRNERETAIRYLRRARALDPAHPESAFLLTDLLLQDGAPDEAIDTLECVQRADPSFHLAPLMLAKVLLTAGKQDRALAQLDALLALDDLTPDLRQDAEEVRSRIRSV